MNKRSRILLIVFVSVVVLFGLCFVCSFVYFISQMDLPETSEPVAVQPTEIPPTEIPPTEIPPTEIPPTVETPVKETLPTSTPTEVPREPAPSCQEIIAQTEGLTDVAWDKYKKDIKGKWVVGWEGTITQVGGESFLTDGYSVHIDVPGGCSLYFVVADEEQALAFSKDQSIIVTGQVRDLADIFFVKTLYLEDSTVELEY